MHMIFHDYICCHTNNTDKQQAIKRKANKRRMMDKYSGHKS